MTGVKPAVGSVLRPHPDTDFQVMDSREVNDKWEHLCEWWVLGTQFQCWIPEEELVASSGGGGQSVGRA